AVARGRHPALDRVEFPMPSEPVASPYDAPELYDHVLDALDFDQLFWLRVARGWTPGAPVESFDGPAFDGRAPGPVLDVGCGTGRVLLRLLEAGIDADGIDNSAPMLARARTRASTAGHNPSLTLPAMRDFTLPR